jgi:MscS family membrane protein
MSDMDALNKKINTIQPAIKKNSLTKSITSTSTATTTATSTTASPSSESFFQDLSHTLIVQLAVLLGVAFVLTLALRILSKKLAKVFTKTKYIWDDAIVDSLSKPLTLLIWSWAFLHIPDVFKSHYTITFLGDKFYHIIDSARMLFLVGCLFWFLLRCVNYMEKEIIFGKRKSPILLKGSTNISAVAKVIRITLILLFILTVLQSINFPLGSFLAVGGFGTVAISFAAKDTLANFFGGMMIFMDKPFEIGDWIRSPDREIEGTVEYIGWRLTRLRTFDKRPLFVPNSVFSTIAIENPTRMHNRRVKKIIGLRYEDAPKVNNILKDIQVMLSNHPEVDKNALTMVNLVEFAESSLNILIYTFTRTTEWAAYKSIQQDILLKIIDIITQHGAECAFPSRTLYIPSDSGSLVNTAGANNETR